MFSNTTRPTAIALLVLVGCGLGLATIGTAAPQENATTANETTINESIDDDERDEDTIREGDLEERVDGDLVITGWEYNRDREAMTIYFELTRERPKTVTITEAISVEDGGTGQMSIRQERLLPGKSSLTVRVSPSPSGEAAVAVTTADSVDRGQGAYVSTGYVERNPFSHTTSTTGWIGGAILSLAFVVAAGVYRIRKEQAAPEVA